MFNTVILLLRVVYIFIDTMVMIKRCICVFLYETFSDVYSSYSTLDSVICKEPSCCTLFCERRKIYFRCLGQSYCVGRWSLKSFLMYLIMVLYIGTF